MSKKRCRDCKYFVAFRNMNYATFTNDTITEYCELLQNEETYDRDKGDEISDNIFDDCPLQKGFVSTESVIKLLKTREELQKQFDDFVHHSLAENERLQKKNEELNTLIINDILDNYQIAFEEVKRGADIIRDLCPTCIHFLKYDAEVSSSEGYVRTTKCLKRGEVKGVLSECNDYRREFLLGVNDE